jgi:hypothetical protein
MIANRIAVCLLLTLTVRLCAEQPTSLPPPPAADMAGATATWSPGHWRWSGSQWCWVPGSWLISSAATPGATPRWITGRWVAGADGTAWVPGHYDDGADAGTPGAPVLADERSAPLPPPPPQQQPVAMASPMVDQTVYVDRPYYSETVVTAPMYTSMCAPVCPPVCVSYPVAVGMRGGGHVCLPLPPLLPVPFVGHHGPGFGFSRLPLPFFNPLALLFHHR